MARPLQRRAPADDLIEYIHAKNNILFQRYDARYQTTTRRS